jgi:hypothetical protein
MIKKKKKNSVKISDVQAEVQSRHFLHARQNGQHLSKLVCHCYPFKGNTSHAIAKHSLHCNQPTVDSMFLVMTTELLTILFHSFGKLLVSFSSLKCIKMNLKTGKTKK